MPPTSRPQVAAEQPVATIRFRSHAPSEAQRAELWHAAVGQFYDVVKPKAAAPDAFHMDLATWNLGPMVAVQAEFGPREQSRSRRKIRGDQLDHFRLILQMRGALRVDANGKQVEVAPGQMLLTDMARPETYSTDAGESIVLFLPRDLVDEALSRPLDLHGLVPVGSTASLLGDHLRAVARHASGMTIREARAVATSTVQLIAGALEATPAARERARPVMESTLLRQICRYVDLHLSEPGLSAEQICKAFKMSRATLYRLCAPLGGIAAYVKERRLERVHALLASAGKRPYLVRLADDHGFSSAGQLSHAFKERFGYSPSDAYAQHAPALAIPARPHPRDDDFFAWLKGLRA